MVVVATCQGPERVTGDVLVVCCRAIGDGVGRQDQFRCCGRDQRRPDINRRGKRPDGGLCLVKELADGYDNRLLLIRRGRTHHTDHPSPGVHHRPSAHPRLDRGSENLVRVTDGPRIRLRLVIGVFNQTLYDGARGAAAGIARDIDRRPNIDGMGRRLQRQRRHPSGAQHREINIPIQSHQLRGLLRAAEVGDHDADGIFGDDVGGRDERVHIAKEEGGALNFGITVPGPRDHRHERAVHFGLNLLIR